MAQIYALYSARDWQVRYVGETIGCRYVRLEEHKKTQTNRFVSAVTEWFWSEWKLGCPVLTALLDTCPNESRKDVEENWMNRFPNLINKQRYHFAGGPPVIVREIQDYKRSHKANCGGYRGLFWWGGIGCYSVLTPSGNWLLGDEFPGKAESIYFSDPASALSARDIYRHEYPQVVWLPDSESAAE